jgi:hypothetical protein
MSQSDVDALRQAIRWADERVLVAGCSIESVQTNERDKAKHLQAMKVAANTLEWLQPCGSRVPAAWSEFGDGHDYSRTGKHDPQQCRPCLRHVIEKLKGPIESRMQDAFFAGVTRANDHRPIHENFEAWVNGKPIPVDAQPSTPSPAPPAVYRAEVESDQHVQVQPSPSPRPERSEAGPPPHEHGDHGPNGEGCIICQAWRSEAGAQPCAHSTIVASLNDIKHGTCKDCGQAMIRTLADWQELEAGAQPEAGEPEAEKTQRWTLRQLEKEFRR